MAKGDDFDFRYYTRKVLDAHGRWNRALKRNDIGFESLEEFAAWLGDPLPRDEIGAPTRDTIVNIYNPEVRRQLDMLTGPHAKTMLKVFLVRRKAPT